MNQSTLTALVLAACTAAAAANDVLVEIHGQVWGNQVNTGAFSNVNPGESVTYSFEIDSTNFADGTFPTRGYTIDASTMTIAFSGGTVVGLANPYPAGRTPMFVLRNNDPQADGFFLGEHPDAFPTALDTVEQGVFGPFGARFNVSYTGDTLNSLNILDAVGFYDYTGLTVFGMGINDGPFEDVVGMDFTNMTISVIPAPASLAGLVPLGLGAARRRR